MPTPISIRGITKEFPAIGAAGITKAVDNVSLEIETGELFFLLGPSGCGKTTLLRMIAGFIDPTHGTILFGDRDVTHLPPNKRNTGMVFQSYALWPHMTIEANVAFGLDVRKTPANEAKIRIAEALAAVRMDQYAKRKPNQLSGGQQQRVALARALVIRPDVLLLDEPLSNLDAKLRLELRSEIRRICKESGITTVYVTHDQKEALSMADRVAILRAGKLEQLGPPADLYKRPHSRFVAEFLGETNILEGTVVAITPDPPTLWEQDEEQVLDVRARNSETPSPMGARAGGGFPAAKISTESSKSEQGENPDTSSPHRHLDTSTPRHLPQHLLHATLQTEAGQLTGLVPEGVAPPPLGAQALISIRPESISLGTAASDDHPHPGRITAATYLGEVEQGQVQVRSYNFKFLRLASLSNPLRPGQDELPVTFTDAVVLPLTDAGSGT